MRGVGLRDDGLVGVEGAIMCQMTVVSNESIRIALIWTPEMKLIGQRCILQAQKGIA